ncbi:hypothetical protein BJY00DRAFT_293726 [Aspergillus carlsbadensis]|nr:hypothetical protein BJY00DRAFT_293726 [Aspergillus carlsbadensis]
MKIPQSLLAPSHSDVPIPLSLPPKPRLTSSSGNRSTRPRPRPRRRPTRVPKHILRSRRSLTLLGTSGILNDALIHAVGVLRGPVSLLHDVAEFVAESVVVVGAVLPDAWGARVSGDYVDVVEVEAPVCWDEWFCGLCLGEGEGGCGYGEEEYAKEKHRD